MWPHKIQMLLEAALALSREHDLQNVLQQIVTGAATLVEARYAALGIYDGRGAIESFIHCGIDDVTVARMGAPPRGHGLLREVIVAGGPIRLPDLEADPRSCGLPPHHPPMRTFLGVPLASGGHRYGNLYLTEKAGSELFDDEDEAIVATLAAFAAAAIDSALLVEAERARVETVAELAAASERAVAERETLRKVFAAQEAERARVSRDLHDEVGQALTTVLLGLRLVESSLGSDKASLPDARRSTDDVRELVADALRTTRRLAFDLRPTVLDDIGLLPALERLVREVTARGRTKVELGTDGLVTAQLSPEVATVTYRVVQEGLTNVLRHARATTASVTVVVAEGRVRALVEDDGIGFDESEVPGRDHLGVAGMAERAALAGGTLRLTSTPGAGTTVLLEVPRV